MEPLCYTPEEAARALAVSRTRLYDLIRTRQIRSVKIGRSRLIPVATLRQYVEKLESAEVSA